MGGECLVVSPSGDDFNSRPCLMHGVEYYLARSCHVSHVVNHECKSEGKWCGCYCWCEPVCSIPAFSSKEEKRPPVLSLSTCSERRVPW